MAPASSITTRGSISSFSCCCCWFFIVFIRSVETLLQLLLLPRFFSFSSFSPPFLFLLFLTPIRLSWFITAMVAGARWWSTDTVTKVSDEKKWKLSSRFFSAGNSGVFRMTRYRAFSTGDFPPVERRFCDNKMTLFYRSNLALIFRHGALFSQCNARA